MTAVARQADVLVIGGGIVGACVARELQSEGRQVLLVERGGIASGSSFGNAGWVTPCFAMPLPQPGLFWKSLGWLMDKESPLHIQPRLSWDLARWFMRFTAAMNRRQLERSVRVLTALSTYSLQFYEDLAREYGDSMDFHRRGLLMVSATRSGVRSAQAEMELMAPHGITGRALDRDELLAFEPSLRPLVQGGVFFDREAQVEPLATTQAVHRAFEALGGQSLLNTEVYDFVTDGKRIREVLTTQGRIQADTIVLAAGSWSPEIGRRLGLRIPILGGKGYAMITRDWEIKPQRPIMIVERKIAVTPRVDSVRLAGTLELVNQDFGISPHRVRAIQKGAEEYLNLSALDHVTELWRGLRPCTPDGVPVIDRSCRLENLVYCTGHQMLGLQSAPGSAKLAADLIQGRSPWVEAHPFRADRFE